MADWRPLVAVALAAALAILGVGAGRAQEIGSARTAAARIAAQLQQLIGATSAGSASTAVVVSVWIGKDGTIRRAKIIRSSGDPRRDRSIEEALLRLRNLPPPPADVPQPITLSIASQH